MNPNLHQFNFSFALAEKAKAEIEQEHEKILERISNIAESEKFYINGFPVLKNIIHLNPKKQDLKKLAKAIDRLSDLIEIFEELDSKINLINTVQKNPNWFAWTFGDFSQDIDATINQLFNSES